MKSKLKNFSIELNFYKTPLENMVAIEFLSHMTTVLTHQNILWKFLGKISKFDLHGLNAVLKVGEVWNSRAVKAPSLMGQM